MKFSAVGYDIVYKMDDFYADVDSYLFTFSSFGAYKIDHPCAISVSGHVSKCKNSKLLSCLMGNSVKCEYCYNDNI